MASGTPSSRNEDDEENDDEEWLDLGLASGPVLPRTEPVARPGSGRVERCELGLGLGLGLGFGDDGVRERGAGLCMVPLFHDHGQHGSSSASLPSLKPPPLALPLLPSSSSSSSSWHVDRSGFLDRGNNQLAVRRVPPRPGVGVWFSLHASGTRNGEGEPLPQIPKAYIRVKDENVTIFMVKTYLVRKLGLTSETEIEITCMGQRLLQWQTLKHVRDAVWFPRVMATTSFHSPMDHFMHLHYERAPSYFFH